MHWSWKINSFQWKKVQSLHTYCPAAIRTAFSPKFVLDVKVKNSVFWNISYLGLCCNWVALNINLKGELVFWILRSSENVKSSGVDWIINKSVLRQTISDKRLWTNSRNYKSYTNRNTYTSKWLHCISF